MDGKTGDTWRTGRLFAEFFKIPYCVRALINLHSLKTLAGKNLILFISVGYYTYALGVKKAVTVFLTVKGKKNK
jgi:hypothetical protein